MNLVNAQGVPIKPPVNIDTVRQEINSGLSVLIKGIGPTNIEMQRANGLADKVGAFVAPQQRLVMWSLPILEEIVAKLEKIEEYLKERGPYDA